MSVAEKVRDRLRVTKLRAPLVWYRHLGLKPNDVLLASFHRSGNTWMRFLLCDILTHGLSDFKNVGFAVPDLRYLSKGYPILDGGRRLIKTHEPYYKQYKKAIYFVRDPRDVAVSCYEFYQTGDSLDDFLKLFVSGKTNPHGTWQRHVQSWLDSPLMDRGDLLVISYERMRLDIEGVMPEVLQFLGVSVEPKVVREAIASNSLERMRAKEDQARASGEGFAGQPIRSRGRRIRIGSIGQWQDTLTEAQVQLIEDHAGELLTRLGYTPHRDLPSSTVLPEEFPAQDLLGADSLPEVGEASA